VHRAHDQRIAARHRGDIMTPMLFDVGGGELLVIILIAVILFGPDKMPDLIKKTGRIVTYLRGIANSATDTLKAQLGPEYDDLTPADLNPRRLLERTVLKEVQADLDAIKAQVDGLKTDLTPATDSVAETLATARTGLAGIGRSLDDATSSLQQAVAAVEPPLTDG